VSANLLDVLGRANPDYVDSLYRQYRQDPKSVDAQWALIFAGYEFALAQGGTAASALAEAGGNGTIPAAVEAGGDGDIHPVLGIFHLIHAYRQYGHLAADLDPLGHSPRRTSHLDLGNFGFAKADLALRVDTGSFRAIDGDATIGELRDALAETYCGKIGVEFVFIPERERLDWLLDRMEPNRNRPALSAETRRRVLTQIVRAEGLERWLHARYRGAKRFSVEGGETLLPLLDTIIEASADAGVEEVAIGMAHRGRLNVLSHTLQKPYPLLISEFEGAPLDEALQGAGDVKYHKGFSSDHVARSGRKVHLTMSPNPSHLEAINPVVEGLVWAKQRMRGDADGSKVLPVLMHGDSSFAGQGIVYETLLLSGIEGYRTGGTVHIIINNQIGFTTEPHEYRSTRYSSDVARALRSPVFHVNGDDPEAVIHVARLAFEYRQAFKTDVFIDLVCYRRHGHNELDDPTFTQPAMYRTISALPTVAEVYGKQLVEAGVLTAAELDAIRNDQRAELDAAQAAARESVPREAAPAFAGLWAGLSWAGNDWSADTAVDRTVLERIADGLARFPDGFTPHPRLPKHFEQMRDTIKAGDGLPWAAGELLAYGTLLLEGTPVRLSGQDAARGTFSHRHALIYDHGDGSPAIPLNHLDPEQAHIQIFNSPLSEAAVLGFEYGVASADPRRLVIWEAQFGDFANGAQTIIDQFIASGEFKWQRQNGVVLLLPHGYEGQGPEHSSGRPERFLQLCAKRNMQVMNLTTPAQMFHALRMQMRRPFRKPLIIMTPKSLLRHKEAVSSLAEFTDAGFLPVIADTAVAPAKVRRVLLCSGKVYYRLAAARAEQGVDNVAIIRVEQLYPFPGEELRRTLAEYAEDIEVVWAQEEHWNQGAWHFVMPILRQLLGEDRPVRYVGRGESPSPATGSHDIHEREEHTFVQEAFHKPGAFEGPITYWPMAPRPAAR
jgi:2-oxoglutarate dehydrogenase E1 component